MLDVTAIDLKTIPGIVAVTIMLVHGLKSWLADVRYLRELPVVMYVVAVAGGLTWLSHDVLHWLAGDRAQLIAQAVIAALSASGAVEWFRAGAKPLARSTKATDTRLRRTGWAILLAVGLGAGVAGCASAAGPLVAADRAVHAAVAQTQDTADRLCDRQILTPAACQQLNADLVPVIESADAFNRAVRADSAAEVPAMIGALDRLARALEQLVPDAAERDAIVNQVNAALAQLRALVGR